MRTIKKSLSIPVAALAVAGMFVMHMPVASAADAPAGGNIGGRPANPDPANPRTRSIFVKTVGPGKSANDSVEVFNSTGSTKQVKVYATDSVRSSGGAFACAQAADPVKAVGGWIKLESADITVPANQTIKVPFTVSPPQNANVGEQNGCIVIQEQTAPTFQGGIGINFRTAIRVAVLVPGAVSKKLSPAGLAVAEKGDKLILTPSAKNDGNISIDTTVDTRVRTLFGTSVSEQSSTFPVLRGERSDWNIEAAKAFWGGAYIASYDLSYDASNNFIGTGGAAKDTKTIDGSKKVFFVAPAPLAIIIELIVLAALITGLMFALRRRRDGKHVRTKWTDYPVKDGDNIQSIAKERNVTWKELARANGLRAPYLLATGTVIKVPARGDGKSSEATRPAHNSPKPESDETTTEK